MVNEYQHKGYAALFGFVALVLTFIFWGIMPPFYWLGSFLFFVIYRPFFVQPEPKDLAHFATDNQWMTGATLAGLLLTMGLSRMTRNWRKS